VDWRERDGVRWLEAELPGARAAFTTRVGGISEGPYESLNLGLLSGDEPERVRTNRHRAAAALGLEPGAVLFARQVHGARVEQRDAAPSPNPYADAGPRLSDADGQATGAAGLAPLVLVADCLPVAVAGRDAVAMLHCGWRGLAAGLVRQGVEATRATAAAIGPGIGSCCYEVGPEVLAEFAPLGDGIAANRMLDLTEVARRLLGRAGVERIEAAKICTSCNAGLFFSARRDGERSGRQGGFVWRANGGG
jgi:YfiH family protein